MRACPSCGEPGIYEHPQPNGSILIEGSIRGKRIRRGPVAPRLDDPLRSLINELVSVDID